MKPIYWGSDFGLVGRKAEFNFVLEKMEQGNGHELEEEESIIRQMAWRTNETKFSDPKDIWQPAQWRISIWVQSWGSCSMCWPKPPGSRNPPRSQTHCGWFLDLGPTCLFPWLTCPTEPAVEISEEHLEEKCSVCGWALPSGEQLSDVSEPVEWRLHYTVIMIVPQAWWV